MGLPWFWEEDQIGQYTWPPGSKLPWSIGSPHSVTLPDSPGFLRALPSPQPAPRFGPAFWPILFLLIGRNEPGKRLLPGPDLTTCRRPTTLGQQPVLFTAPWVSVLVTTEPALFCLVVKSSSARGGVLVVLFFSILFSFPIVKNAMRLCFSEYDWDDHVEFYTQICISDPLTLFFCFPFLLTLWTGQSLFPFWHPSAKPPR